MTEVTNLPYRDGIPFSTATPFTYREGVTMLELIRAFKAWVDKHVPELNGIIENIYKEIDGQAESWDEKFNLFMQNVTQEIATLGDASIALLIEDGISQTYDALEKWIEPKVSAVGDKAPTTFYYVDAVNGDDDLNDGSELSPFKTIQHAVDRIPMLIKNDHWVKVYPGEYPEDVRIRGVIGANVGITATGEEPVDVSNPTPVKIRSLTAFDMKGRLLIWGFTTFDTESYTGGPFRFSRCTYVSWRSCHVASNTKQNAVAAVTFDGSTGTVNSAYFDNQHRILDIMNGSNVLVFSANRHGPNPSTEGILVSAAAGRASGRLGWLRDAIPNSKAIVLNRGGTMGGDGWTNFTPNPMIYNMPGFPYPRPLKNVQVSHARYSFDGNTVTGKLRFTCEIPEETLNPDTQIPEAVTPFNYIQFDLPLPCFITPNSMLGSGMVNESGFKPVYVMNQSGLGVARKNWSGDTLWTGGTTVTLYLEFSYEVA